MQYLLHQSIQRAAERYPQRPAFRFLDQQLDYAQLAERVQQLARVLREQGVRRGDRVALYLNKSLESAVAIYAIMHAGAAYVPLDPGAPVGRLAGMLRGCGVRCLISHEARRADLKALLQQPTPLEAVIGVSELNMAGETGMPSVATVSWEQIASAPSGADPAGARPMEQDLAYIMYTSGSTGEPKGIMHTHASGLSYARRSVATYGVHYEDRLSNHSPLHFDMSTFDYFCGPLVGAATVIIPEAYAKLPASLSELIERERLSLWYSVPFALIQLLLHGLLEHRDLSALRWVMFGGEPFAAKHLQALMRQWPNARFSNVYGPAEVNQCSYYHLPPNWRADDGSPPIGRIWPNAEGLVLDPHDRVVARGQPGELVVRTPTMMRGYWHRPDLNRKAFFQRDVGSDVSDRFYRTGDIVVELEDGELAFHGRLDRQIKLRGFRVELDEIESVLTRHPAVEEAAAYQAGDDDNGPIIAAAVSLNDGAQLSEQQLRQYAALHLAAYAVPERLQVIGSFPRTTSGKIDRRALSNATIIQQRGETA